MRELGGQEMDSGRDLSIGSAQDSSVLLQVALTHCLLRNVYFNHWPYLKGN